MSTLTDAATQLQRAAARLPFASNELAKQAALAIIQDLVLVTPVDVGTAISNWQVSLDAPALESIPAISPSQKGKTVKGEWTHSVAPDITRENNASAVLALASSIIAAKQPSQLLFIVNNLPYIQVLDRGSSDQAPAGFVDRVTMLAQSFVDKGLILG